MPEDLPTPATALYRLGRKPSAASWPEPEWTGTGRFDDVPEDPLLYRRTNPRYRVLYAGERLACSFEKLAPFRPERGAAVRRPITISWIRDRRVCKFRIRDPEQRLRWLDLRSPATYADFRVRFESHLRNFGFSDFDLAAATSESRGFTRPIGGWAFEQGYQGIRYATRHTPDLDCWAIFSGIDLDIEEDRPIAIDDVDLRRVATAWSIPLPAATPRGGSVP